MVGIDQFRSLMSPPWTGLILWLISHVGWPRFDDTFPIILGKCALDIIQEEAIHIESG